MALQQKISAFYDVFFITNISLKLGTFFPVHLVCRSLTVHTYAFGVPENRNISYFAYNIATFIHAYNIQRLSYANLHFCFTAYIQ